MLAHDLFARFAAHQTRSPSHPLKNSQNNKVKSDQRKEIHGTPTPQTVDTVRATTPPAYPFPQTNNVNQPGINPQNPLPGKKQPQEPNPSGPSGTVSHLSEDAPG